VSKQRDVQGVNLGIGVYGDGSPTGLENQDAREIAGDRHLCTPYFKGDPMLYTLRDETYDDDQLEEMTDNELRLLLADCEAERTHTQAYIQRKQLEFKRGGTGLLEPEHTMKKTEVTDLLAMEAQIRYLQTERSIKD
jgi:hypothetical protein